jgi:hypothetical protein
VSIIVSAGKYVYRDLVAVKTPAPTYIFCSIQEAGGISWPIAAVLPHTPQGAHNTDIAGVGGGPYERDN